MVAPLNSSNSGRNQKKTEYQANSTIPISLPINTTGVQIDLVSQVTGTLGVNHGGTGVISSTGSGNTVLSDGATLDDPTITTDLTMDEGANIVLGTTTGTQIGTAASQLLAFYGQTAIVQPDTAITPATVVIGAGTPVTDASTFDGYTLAQVIAAMRAEGLLA